MTAFPFLTQWHILEQDPLLQGYKKRRLQPRRWLGNGREQTQTQQHHVPRPLPVEPSRKNLTMPLLPPATLQASNTLAKIPLPEESPGCVVAAPSQPLFPQPSVHREHHGRNEANSRKDVQQGQAIAAPL